MTTNQFDGETEPAGKRPHFTLEEATQRLPLIRSILNDLVPLAREIDDRQSRLHTLRSLRSGNTASDQSPYGDELRQMEDELREDREQLVIFIGELSNLGVAIDNASEGQVDFPAYLDGREVAYSWRLDEDEITHWHELDAFDGTRHSLLEGSGTGAESSENGCNQDS